jgi:hypothetical protein
VSIEIVNNITLGTTGEDKIIGTSDRDFFRGLLGNGAIDGGGEGSNIRESSIIN